MGDSSRILRPDLTPEHVAVRCTFRYSGCDGTFTAYLKVHAGIAELWLDRRAVLFIISLLIGLVEAKWEIKPWKKRDAICRSGSE